MTAGEDMEKHTSAISVTLEEAAGKNTPQGLICHKCWMNVKFLNILSLFASSATD